MVQEYDKKFQSIEFSFRGKALLTSESIKAHNIEAAREAVEAVSKATAEFMAKEITASAQALPNEFKTKNSDFISNLPETQKSELKAGFTAEVVMLANNLSASVRNVKNQVTKDAAVQAAIDQATQSVDVRVSPPTQNSGNLSFSEAVSNLEQKIKRLGSATLTYQDEVVLRNLLATLNQNSTIFVEEIEHALQEVLPPYITVKADVNFTKGSIVITGTIMLLDWIGSTIFQAGKQAFEEEFGSIVKMVVKRVFSDVISQLGLTQYITMNDVWVTAKPGVPGSQKNHSVTAQKDNEQDRLDEQSSLRQVGAHLPTRNLYSQIMQWMILVAVLILLVDRFLTINLKP